MSGAMETAEGLINELGNAATELGAAAPEAISCLLAVGSAIGSVFTIAAAGALPPPEVRIEIATAAEDAATRLRALADSVVAIAALFDRAMTALGPRADA